MTLIAETQLEAYVRDGGLTFAQEPFRLLDPRPQDILMGSQSGGLPEKPAEGIGTHLHILGHFLQPQLIGQIRFDVFKCLAEPLPRHTTSDFS